jgi:hypothetical protein
MQPDFLDYRTMKNICLALDQDPNIRVGAVLRVAPMRDDDGQVIGYWIIDDRSGEPIDLVSAESVRVTGE